MWKILLLCLIGAQTAAQAKPMSDQAQHYLFFLHNRWVEDHALDVAHPDYGICEYEAIIDTFEAHQFQVISEIRPSGTDAPTYARQVVIEIDRLIALGIAPERITVVGTSKGGYIAMYVSSFLQNPAVNFVFIGCCVESNLTELPAIQFCGRILSIYEESDDWGQSCQSMKDRSNQSVSAFQEIALQTGLRHGYLFKAMPAWMEPVITFASSRGE